MQLDARTWQSLLRKLTGEPINRSIVEQIEVLSYHPTTKNPIIFAVMDVVGRGCIHEKCMDKWYTESRRAV